MRSVANLPCSRFHEYESTGAKANVIFSIIQQTAWTKLAVHFNQSCSSHQYFKHESRACLYERRDGTFTPTGRLPGRDIYRLAFI